MHQETSRDLLIDAAERLFAERGLASVSLREINKAAGQRNTSAIHYHFGSKEALVLAIFERRMSRLNARRMSYLDAVEASGRAGDLHAILCAMLQPMTEGLDEGESGLNYLLFFGQVLNESHSPIRAAIDAPFSEGMRRGRAMIAAVLREVPEPILEQRGILATELTIQAVAHRARILRAGAGAAREITNAAFAANLVDFLAGALSAPVSEAAGHPLREAKTVASGTGVQAGRPAAQGRRPEPAAARAPR